MNNQAIEQIKTFVAQFTLKQKIAAAAVTAVSLFSLIFLMVWANRPDYGLLYSNLEAGDAAEIVEDLRGNNVPYKLKDGGKTIMVPTKEIYELRIAYAGRNLVSSGAVGYEIFDKNNLGLTEFMQKVNLKRALQGELAKTINQIEAVQQTRIHLVIPEPSLFEDQETKSSASVVVKLKGGRSLSRQQISGITQMVAGSVEGLAAEDVHIVDSFGNVLTRGSKAENEVGLSNTQLELKQKVEKYLSGKAQSMLDAVLGKANAIVRVSAALNFDRITRTTENYDPENTAVLSEERNDERSTRPDTALYQRQNSVTNYELNKTKEQFQGSIGDIKRLSIAVFVNGIPNIDPETGVENYTQRDQAEIDKITEIVRGAVGFSTARQDDIVVHQQIFDRTDYTREKRLLASMEQKELMTDMIKIGLIAGGGLILFLLLRTILKKFNVEEFAGQYALPAGQPTTERLIADTEQEEEFDLTELDLSKERDRIKAQERVAKEVTEFTTADPQRATRILKYWLMEADKE